MQGNTNAVISGNGNGGGDEITAINMSGAKLSKDEKVWINNKTQTENSKYFIAKGTSLISFISCSGSYAYINSKEYLLKESQAESVATIFKTDTGGCLYLRNNFIVKNNNQACNDYMVIIPEISGYFIPASNTLYQYKQKIYKIDMLTGNVIKTYTKDETETSTSLLNDYLSYCYLDGYIYDFYSSSSYKYIKLNDNTNTWKSEGSFVVQNSDGMMSRSFIGQTSDNKFLIFSSGSTGYILLVKNLGDNVFRALNINEVPAKLQKFYKGGSLSSKCYCTFNCNNNLLICHTTKSRSSETEPFYKDMVALQWNGSDWVEVLLDFEIPESGTTSYYFKNFERITVNNNISRMIVTYRDSLSRLSDAHTYCYNLKTQNTYGAYKFSQQTSDAETLTGYAKENADAEQNVKISTVLPPKTTLTVTTNADNATITME